MFRKKKKKEETQNSVDKKQSASKTKTEVTETKSTEETKNIDELIDEIDLPEPEENEPEHESISVQDTDIKNTSTEQVKKESILDSSQHSNPSPEKQEITLPPDDPLNTRIKEAFEKLESMTTVLETLQSNFQNLTGILHDSNELKKTIPGEVRGEETGHLEKPPKFSQQNFGSFSNPFQGGNSGAKPFSRPQEFSNIDQGQSMGNSSHNMMSFIVSKMLEESKEEPIPDKSDKEKYIFYLLEKSKELVKDQEFLAKLSNHYRSSSPSETDKSLLISMLLK